MFHDPKQTNWLFEKWKNFSTECEGKFVGYCMDMADLYIVTLDNSFLIGQKGGEDLKNLANPPAEIRVAKGYIRQACQGIPKYRFRGYLKNHLDQWMDAYSLEVSRADSFLNKTFIALRRHDYISLYHQMTEIDNAFVVMSFFNLTQADTNILYVDSHPWGSLDLVWSTLFNSVERAVRLPTRTTINRLIFGYMGYCGPMYYVAHAKDQEKNFPSLPLVEEFRAFLLWNKL